MENTKQKLKNIADTLYKGDTLLGISMMSEVLEDLAKIGTIIKDEDLNSRYINDGLTQALEAMENNDGTLLADVITYELIEIIEELQ